MAFGAAGGARAFTGGAGGSAGARDLTVPERRRARRQRIRAKKRQQAQRRINVGNNGGAPAPVFGADPAQANGGAAPSGSAPGVGAPATLPWQGEFDEFRSEIAGRIARRNEVELPAARRQLALSYYGTDDQAMIAAGGFNPDDPFSRAALLNRAYKDRSRHSLNSMAAGGQLYSGARAQQDRLDNDWYSQGIDSLAKAYTGEVSGAERAVTDANDADRDALASALLELATRAGNDVGAASAPAAAPKARAQPKRPLTEKQRLLARADRYAAKGNTRAAKTLRKRAKNLGK